MMWNGLRFENESKNVTVSQRDSRGMSVFRISKQLKFEFRFKINSNVGE